jgi:undecaprenyl diphosphate synthase
MRLFRRSLLNEAKRCLENGVRLTIVGRRDRLSPGLIQTIHDAEALTAHGRNLHLRVAIDYSSRDAILRAAKLAAASGDAITRESFGELLARVDHDSQPSREVDLLVRTGGEQRLSDFLLWECAYAELYFTDVMWPEFRGEQLERALMWFAERDRRFGGLATQAAS